MHPTQLYPPQINQFDTLNNAFFFSFKWAPTIIRLLVTYYTCEGKKTNKPKNIKLSYPSNSDSFVHD